MSGTDALVIAVAVVAAAIIIIALLVGAGILR